MLEMLDEDGTRSMGVSWQRPSQLHERDARVRREPLDRTMCNGFSTATRKLDACRARGCKWCVVVH